MVVNRSHQVSKTKTNVFPDAVTFAHPLIYKYSIFTNVEDFSELHEWLL